MKDTLSEEPQSKLALRTEVTTNTTLFNGINSDINDLFVTNEALKSDNDYLWMSGVDNEDVPFCEEKEVGGDAIGQNVDVFKNTKISLFDALNEHEFLDLGDDFDDID